MVECLPGIHKALEASQHGHKLVWRSTPTILAFGVRGRRIKLHEKPAWAT